MSILGWRQWAVDIDGLLRPAWSPWSSFRPDLLLWRPDGLTVACCLRAERRDPADRLFGLGALPPHPRMPAEECVCGLYAWRTPQALSAAPRPTWTSRPIVVGATRLGGRVIVTQRGYRAGLGYPAAVLDPTGAVSLAYRLARYRSWEALVGEWNECDSPPALSQGA